MYEDRRLVKIIEQNKMLPKAMELPPDGTLLYHYTSLEVLWKCIEGNSMYARHVRFSNDNQEYEIGEERILKFLKEKGLNAHIQDTYFMICFCEKEDLLSQWRGYAEDGVCIGFDFSYGELFNNYEHKKKVISKYHKLTLLNSEEYAKKEEELLKDKHSNFKDNLKAQYTVKDKATTIISVPYKVSYICGENEEGFEDKELKFREKLDEIYQSIEERSLQEYLLCKYIPYIKHAGFEEESEYRLLFDLHDIGDMSKREKEDIWDKKITYIEKVKGVKLPNIIVRFGDMQEQSENCKYIILEGELYTPRYKEFFDEINNMAKENNIKIIKGEKNNSDIVVSEGMNQEKISFDIETIMDKCNIKRDGNDTRIWFKGHLPIRTIMIAPGENMERIKGSIEFYKNRIYWLKYVKVSCSKIPYRKN